MAHQFTVNATIHGVSIDEFKRLVADVALHEAVCKRIPAENLEILESKKNGDIYTLRRAYNLDVNIPDMAKKLLKDAFELREYNTLSKYVSSDWIAYTDQPHRYYPKAQVTFGSKYFPESDTVSPYTSCDTAFRDLFIYANAMQNVVREDTATLRKILRQEKEDYDKSKARCKKRVDMTYQEAWEAEENE